MTLQKPRRRKNWFCRRDTNYDKDTSRKNTTQDVEATLKSGGEYVEIEI